MLSATARLLHSPPWSRGARSTRGIPATTLRLQLQYVEPPKVDPLAEKSPVGGDGTAPRRSGPYRPAAFLMFAGWHGRLGECASLAGPPGWSRSPDEGADLIVSGGVSCVSESELRVLRVCPADPSCVQREEHAHPTGGVPPEASFFPPSASVDGVCLSSSPASGVVRELSEVLGGPSVTDKMCGADTMCVTDTRGAAGGVAPMATVASDCDEAFEAALAASRAEVASYGPRDSKLRRMEDRFAAGISGPHAGGWIREDGGHEVFVKDEISPAAPFVEVASAAKNRRIYRDDDGVAFSYDFDSLVEHPIDSEEERAKWGAIDEQIAAALDAATADGVGGARSTGVRAWHQFCKAFGVQPLQPMDVTAPLARKLAAERMVMRYVMWLVDSRDILASTAANYLGSVQGWHLRRTGVKLVAGMRLARVAEMVKGLRRLRGDPGRRVRRGVSPDVLRAQMDAFLDPSTIEGANMRAALALGFQGLLRGAEITVRQRSWDKSKDLSRADVAELSEDRAVVMMLPCKNMQHLSGKTVPLVVGGGGTFIDAPAELLNLARVDPVNRSAAASTPLFRHANGSAITEAELRETVKALMAGAGADGADFGAHSLRIGGATALYKAGASHLDIMTMGRWSSDCYRLYVRACFGGAVRWSRLAGSTPVDDVAAISEYREVDCF